MPSSPPPGLSPPDGSGDSAWPVADGAAPEVSEALAVAPSSSAFAEREAEAEVDPEAPGDALAVPSPDAVEPGAPESSSP